MNILFLSIENPVRQIGGHHIRTFNILKLLSQNNKIFFIGIAKNADEQEAKKAELERFCERVDIFIKD